MRRSATTVSTPFLFVDGSGAKHPIRWSLVPAAQPVAISPEELAKRGPDFLEQEITQRVAAALSTGALWSPLPTPVTQLRTPTRRGLRIAALLNVGTLTVQQIEPERDGPCRDINFDPTVLPAGITTSDDPFPAARSAAYSRSYNSRTAEASYYPRTATGGKQ